jgi:hypothetical protein
MLADQPADPDALFLRSVLYGVGAAFAGLALYAIFSVMTGIFSGLVALAVQWMVSHAMLAGSGGTGGRRHQIVAVVLVYFAVSGAAVPIFFYQLHKIQARHDAVEAELSEVDHSSSGERTVVIQKQRPVRQTHFNYVFMATMAFILLFFSPFLALAGGIFGGLLGLVMLGLGMYMAWSNLSGAYKPTIVGPLPSAP